MITVPGLAAEALGSFLTMHILDARRISDLSASSRKTRKSKLVSLAARG